MTTTLGQTVFSPWLTPVRLVSTGNIAGTYYNGPSNNGVGATLTVAASSLTVDSVVAAEGDRILLQTQTNTYEQGIYIVESIGATVVLKRAFDQQSIEQLKAGENVAVGAGSLSAGNFYTLVEPLPQEIGVDAIVYNSDPAAGGVTFSGAASTANAIAVFSDTAGNIKAANAAPVTLGQNLAVTGTGTFSGALSSTAGDITSGSSGNAGAFVSFPATAANGVFTFEALNAGGAFNTTLRNSVMGQSSVISLPDPGVATANVLLSESAGTQTVATGSISMTLGNFTVAAGNIAATLGSLEAGTTVTAGTNVVAGNAASAGSVTSFAGTGSTEFLRLAAINNTSGNFSVTISNAAATGQSQTISIPDSGAATANFLLDAGAANLLAQQMFVGLKNVLTFGTGTWTVTRIAQGNYVSRHTPGDETSIIGIDITPMIRTTASKGFRLDSFDVIYAVAANALDAHSVTLDRIAYANNVAVSVTSIPVTGALATATQANPYVTAVTVDTPAFDVTTDSKYIIEVTVDNAAASEYDFYGIMLKFSQTIG
jgi:hypothetical protein